MNVCILFGCSSKYWTISICISFSTLSDMYFCSASGRVRATVGKATLLTTKKFHQFQDLCHKNLVRWLRHCYSITSVCVELCVLVLKSFGMCGVVFIIFKVGFWSYLYWFAFHRYPLNRLCTLYQLYKY